MQTLAQAETEVWRLLLLRREGSELLALENELGLFLPCVNLPIHRRLPRELNEQIKAVWNLESVSLYPLDCDAHTKLHGPRYHIAEALEPDAELTGPGHWLPVSGLAESQFAEPADCAAICEWQRWDRGLSKEETVSFGRMGSFDRIRQWVQGALEPHDLTLTGSFVQLSAGRSFSLIRFETEAHAVWFKAVGEPNQREFPLTILLCEQFPSFTPQLLAIHPGWNAWLTTEVPATPLSESDHPGHWVNAARDLASLQVNSVPVLDRILLCRPRDVRLSTLESQIHPFFAWVRALMDQQTKSIPPRLRPGELAELKDRIGEAICRLRGAGLPDTVGHLDLNPANIVALSNRTVFLDWAEASVGHPFFSLAHLLEHCRQCGRNSSDYENHLVTSYLSVWAKHWRPPDAKKNLCLAVLLAVVAHAVSTDAWRDGTALEDPRMAGYYRSLARRMKWYSDRLRDGASQVSEMFD